MVKITNVYVFLNHQPYTFLDKKSFISCKLNRLIIMS